MGTLTQLANAFDAGDGDFSHLEEAIAAPSAFDLGSVSVDVKQGQYDHISVLGMAIYTHMA